MDSDYVYSGQELELFAKAAQWKSYFATKLGPHLQGRVVESGAGLGANTSPLLASSSAASWLCLEPDSRNFEGLSSALARLGDPRVSARKATVVDLQERSADTILYIDVLEHIENDADELRAAASALDVGGRIAVLAPAHPSLYSEFDKAIGHYRRYTRDSLSKLAPADCRLVESYYLDSVGLLASTANRFLLKQGTPNEKQIRFWDKCLVTASKVIDPIVMHRLGKSVVAVWERC